jgi:hypothetical protein
MRWIDSTQGQKWIKKGVWKCPDIEAIGPNNTTYNLPTSIFATTDPTRAGDVASSSTSSSIKSTNFGPKNGTPTQHLSALQVTDHHLHTHSCVVTGMITINNKTITVNVLIDTGCLQGNYCSEQLGTRLMEEGQPPHHFQTIPICSPIADKCTTSTKSFNIKLGLSLKLEQTPMI